MAFYPHQIECLSYITAVNSQKASTLDKEQHNGDMMGIYSNTYDKTRSVSCDYVLNLC